jgi:hypothetical protein
MSDEEVEGKPMTITGLKALSESIRRKFMPLEYD